MMDSFPAGGRPTYEGLIKVKLAHARGASVLLPDLIALDLGRPFCYQPKFFTASLMSFLGEGAYAQFGLDTDTGAPLTVGFTRDQLVRHCLDGAQIYRCRVAGPENLRKFAAGTCAISDNGEVTLDLFHHTAPATVDKIKHCGYFIGSKWNIQGTRELSNVAYAYFTSLPAIRCDEDLQHIAMASSGQIHLLPTNARSLSAAIGIEVYRQSTFDRRATISVSVPAEFVAPQHVYRHSPHGEPDYFEICHPAIARVGLAPRCVIPFRDGQLISAGGELKRFDYVVLGDADTASGLTAPYNEEETESLFFIERCPSETFFDFWTRNANTDQTSGRAVEMQRLVPR